MSIQTSKKAGIKDIAAKAGVSIGTVDRVLHNRGEVNEETRKKVLKIVKELGYRPNIFAKSLASKKTTRIAIVIPDSSDDNPYWEIPIQGIKKAAEELATYNTEIIYVHFDASSEESFKRVLNDVCKQMPDGIVLNPVFRSLSLHYIELFNERNIPYVFIDVNIKGVGKLGYFGQDAEQSGVVAAQLMNSTIPNISKVLIIKQTNKKLFSQHIEARVSGFLKYFNQQQSSISSLNAITIEIDLLEKNEPDATIRKVISEHADIKGIFIPNSRAFLLADYLETNKHTGFVIIGYDLVTRNIEHLVKGNISYIISQKPEVQANNAIMALFDHLITKKEVEKTNFSPIDIIVKENLEYYENNHIW
jgi:LacI family transcriptional regulator